MDVCKYTIHSNEKVSPLHRPYTPAVEEGSQPTGWAYSLDWAGISKHAHFEQPAFGRAAAHPVNTLWYIIPDTAVLFADQNLRRSELLPGFWTFIFASLACTSLVTPPPKKNNKKRRDGRASPSPPYPLHFDANNTTA